MNIEQLRAAIAWISACLREIHDTATARGAAVADASERSAAEALTADEQSRWDEGHAEVERLNGLIARHEQLERLAGQPAHVAPGVPEVIVRTGDAELYTLDGVAFGNGGAVRSRALAVLERGEFNGLEDHQRQQAERLTRSLDPSVAARIVVTSAPAYRSAFFKVVGGRSELLNPDERQALERAVALGGTAGYAVPAMLDTTIIDTGAHSTNPFRQLSTIKQITGTFWQGTSSAGVTASWDGEGTEVSDDAPTLAEVKIPTFKGQVFVPFSVESEDWATMEADVRAMIAVAKDDLEGAAFVSGNGTTAPQGVITALDGTAQEIAPATAETFARADVEKLPTSVASRFRRNGAFVANEAWYQGIRAFETTVPVGSLLAASTGNGPGSRELIGYPAYESSDMDSALPVASATADNFGLLFGDFAQGYYIVDRVGLTVELVPHLFHTGNNRPSGQRGFLAWFRTGAKVVNLSALAVLSIPTTA